MTPHRKHNFSGGPKHRHNFYLPVDIIRKLKAISTDNHQSMTLTIVNFLKNGISNYTQQK